MILSIVYKKKLYICSVFHDIDYEWHTSSVRTMSIYNDKNYIGNVINLNLITLVSHKK